MDTPAFKLNILLIDDEFMVLELASEILTYLGHKVYIANSGLDGLKIYKENQNIIDVIIVDLLMPDMNGKEFYDKVRAFDSDVPIIISTGISDAKEKETLKNLQVVDFLEKPYTVPQLEAIINKVRKLAKQ
ncbi:MAG TPA: response regulator [Caldithrix abyssi]|uniref:Response regulator n=1 Tax=Caldithrix abyssi TaxID=187145 RepID=A0A7V5H2E0_CALAY|nr:response regulator [Caldithrix abyssi]